MKKYLNLIAILAVLGIGAILGGTALSTSAQQSTWTPAPGTPPNCPNTTPGCNAPINVGSLAQVKTGWLTLGKFIFNPTGNPGSVPLNSVLTAMDTDGTVGWAAAGGGSGIPSNIVVLDNTTPNWTVPAGVTRIMVEVWGGGGGSSFDDYTPNTGGHMWGGAGGGYAKGVYSVTPGAVYNVTVGIGGTGNYSGSGQNGTPSSFGSLVVATGGGACQSCIVTAAAAATNQVPLGGTGTAGLLTMTGGNGFNAITYKEETYNSNPNYPTGWTSDYRILAGQGGQGANGGAGGRSGVTVSDLVFNYCSDGQVPGGGAGGGYKNSAKTQACNGAKGRVVIQY
jgi:hypothetical protein